MHAYGRSALFVDLFLAFPVIHHARMTVQKSLDITVVVLEAVGCLLLSALVVTVSLSESLHRHDPVFNNFLYTWVMYASLAIFEGLVALSNQQLGDPASLLGDVFTIMTMGSTFNLSIHLWFTMREGMHPVSARVKKVRTLMLVVTPYILGLIPLPILFTKVFVTIAGLALLALAVATPVLDVFLLLNYWRYNRKTRSTMLQSVLSTSFLLRLFGFALYRLAWTALFVMAMITDTEDSSALTGWDVAFTGVRNSFPLLAFCVLGLHTDILQLWFPCLWNRKERASDKEHAQTFNVSSSYSEDMHTLLDRKGAEDEESVQ